MSSKKVRKQSKFMRYITGPIRLLTRALDLYIQSLTGSGGHVSYGNTMGCPTPQIPTLPKSFSVNSSSSFKTAEEELRDLIRLASTRSLNGKIDAELRRSKSSMPLGGGGGGMASSVPRSNTVAFGRIDENKPFEFGEEEEVGLLGEVYPRSRIHAVSGRIKVA